jgi:hypothetical protein
MSAVPAPSSILERHPPVALRRVVHRTRGSGHGRITRLARGSAGCVRALEQGETKIQRTGQRLRAEGRLRAREVPRDWKVDKDRPTSH